MNKSTQIPLFDPIEISLGKDRITIIDPVDADLLKYSWCYCNKYARARYNGGKILLHTVILERILGRALLPGEQCDHIDRNHLNNRRDNLRVATHSQNQMNKKVRKTSKTGLKGVVAPEGRHYKYRAHINYKGKRHWLGSFDTAEEAHLAYCEAAKKLFGEFANCD